VATVDININKRRYILDNDYVDRDFDDDLSKITESSTPVETPDE
jgi:hypothetical protein